MAEPFLGEIRMVGFNFAPQGWAFCDGQLLPISQNAALFSLLGPAFAGDGRNTFALPDLRGRVPLKMGQGPGLSGYTLGQHGGSEGVSLTSDEMPQHTHMVNINNQPGNQKDPTNQILSVVNDASGREPTLYPAYSNASPTGQLSSGAVAPAGNSQPHQNLQPYLTVNFIIALQGIFPARS